MPGRLSRTMQYPAKITPRAGLSKGKDIKGTLAWNGAVKLKGAKQLGAFVLRDNTEKVLGSEKTVLKLAEKVNAAIKITDRAPQVRG